MGFGLNITDNTLQPPKGPEMVNYNGVMTPKYKARAMKAWDTMKKRGHKSKQQPYSLREKKITILNQIEKHIKEDENIHPKTFISLETSEYNLPKKLPDFDFFIAQNDRKEYQKMINNIPKNVKMIYYGNISDFKYLNIKPTYIFFDFCKTFTSCENILSELSSKINDSYKIFLTVCLRKMNKEIKDYKFDLSNKIHEIFPDFKIIEAIPYRDKNHPPMIFFILVNLQHSSLDIFDRFSYTKIYEHNLINFCIDKIKIQYPDFYKELKEKTHIDRVVNETSESQKKYRPILEDLFISAIKEHILIIPFNNTNNERFLYNRIDSLSSDRDRGYFEYFLSILNSRNFDEMILEAK